MPAAIQFRSFVSTSLLLRRASPCNLTTGTISAVSGLGDNEGIFEADYPRRMVELTTALRPKLKENGSVFIVIPAHVRDGRLRLRCSAYAHAGCPPARPLHLHPVDLSRQ
jgi:hypothetical protein